jgi:hypothetical protein
VLLLDERHREQHAARPLGRQLAQPARDLRVERVLGGLGLALRGLEVAERVGRVAAARRQPALAGPLQQRRQLREAVERR